MTIRRPDGSWIFHFVNVVDDIEMQITHVIRGEDHLSNTPKHLELFMALGKRPPQYAHIPLILNKNGSKMSKRDEGASITSYIENGYVPAAVRNYLALLGWSPKDGREELALEETIGLFDLDKVHRKNAQFDIDKCLWLNGQHILHMSAEEFQGKAVAFLRNRRFAHCEHASLPRVLVLIQEKVKSLAELPAAIGFFFEDDFAIDQAAYSKAFSSPEIRPHLLALADAFAAETDWSQAALEQTLKETAAKLGIKSNSLLLPLRVAISGRAGGPGLYPVLEILGRERTLFRLRKVG
jgi:glutamyl-tRNA synthetase